MSARLFASACVVGLLSLGTVAWAQQAQTQSSGQNQNASSGDAAKGKQLVLSDGCYECHGTVGEGGNAGPRIARTALPYNAFLQQLRTPASEMPPYEPGILSDADAANIFAYLQSLPAPQAVKDIPLLSQYNQ